MQRRETAGGFGADLAQVSVHFSGRTGTERYEEERKIRRGAEHIEPLQAETAFF